jgi:hypothetical protein
MLHISRTKDQIKADLDCFIWDFKIGDNILYNLNALFNLADDYNNSGKDYKKPISVTVVSIIEAIMVDFLYRLDRGTTHFPTSLRHIEKSIKNQLNEETIKSKFVGPDGQEHCYLTLKNFNFSSMIEVYEKLKLFGDNRKVYESLLRLSYFRNRIHINNYFNNFEKNENVTFSENRVQKTIVIMLWIIDYFKKEYSRPWPTA